MKKTMIAGLACAAVAGPALAGGIDRSGQDVGIIFEEGNRVELTYIYTDPSLSGDDMPQFGGSLDTGARYHDVAKPFGMARFGVKLDLSEKFSLIFTSGEDFGVDVDYAQVTHPNGGAGSLLGGTYADVDSNAISLIGRYKFNQNFSVHGGLRYQIADVELGLDGIAYGPVRGYELDLKRDRAMGYLLGAAYEIPDIALRVALTYFSEVEHNFKTSETMNGQSLGTSSSTQVVIPKSINLDFQTGIAKDTLLFGQIRFMEHDALELEPDKFSEITGGRGIVALDNSTQYLIGVGRRFSDSFSASVSYLYDDYEGDKLVSPLAPNHGLQAIRVGGKYTINNIELSAGARYSWFNEAKAQTGGTARANFTDNDAITVGAKIAYKF